MAIEDTWFTHECDKCGNKVRVLPVTLSPGTLADAVTYPTPHCGNCRTEMARVNRDSNPLLHPAVA